MKSIVQLCTLILVVSSALCATTTKRPSTDCPLTFKCPGHCSTGFKDGCETCTCPDDVKVPPRPSGEEETVVTNTNCGEFVCPTYCSIGFNESCPTCVCPNTTNPLSGCSVVFCPGECSLTVVDVCPLCLCPDDADSIGQPEEEKCDEKTPCKGAHTECTEFGFCICATGYTMVRTTKTCVQTPKLGETCLIKNNPVYCEGYGVDYNCNLEKGPNYGKCICESGYELTPSKDACQRIEKVIDQSCNNDRECVVAYSYCSAAKKCSCIPGFSKDKSGLCKSAGFACPSFFDRSVDNKPGKECEVYYDSDTSQEFNTCKSNEFCYQHPKERSTLGRNVGHCCPLPPANVGLGLVCPLTIGYNGTCPDTSDLPADSVAPPDKIATCPFTTHDCVRQPLRREEICCPLPCRATSSHFNVNGLCYDYVLLDQPCKHTAQCTGGSECSKNGSGPSTCQCKTGFKRISSLQCAPK